ncbi:hypothetical protein [Brachybacterium sp. YJGR34]|uniref:hypothetical protein n=1 Tax=Brachybacterium sp. YJGR34 TaxID=2059911 RepID=UPI0018E5E685|nr:hypothetical protein [Brachybacterium sp. YJGR34]
MSDENLVRARARHRELYGPPIEARAYAEDLGAVHCEECGAVYFAQPGLPRDGHDCPD